MAPLALTKQVCLGSVPVGGCAHGAGRGDDGGPRTVAGGPATGCIHLRGRCPGWEWPSAARSWPQRRPFGAGMGHPVWQSQEMGWCQCFFGSQGRAWLPQGFPEPPLPASLAAPMGRDNSRMKNGATVLKHATSWGFIGGAAASANGLNNLAVTSREKRKTRALFPYEISKLFFAWCSIVVEMESPELKLAAALAQPSPCLWP